MKIEFTEKLSSDFIAFAVFEDIKIPQTLKIHEKYINLVLKTCQFAGKKGESCKITLEEKGKQKVLIAVGLGKADKFEELSAQKLGGQFFSLLNAAKLDKACIISDLHGIKIKKDLLASLIAMGIKLKSYKFNKYRTVDVKDYENKITNISVLCDDIKAAKDYYKKHEAIAEGVSLARNYVSEPPNILYPESYADDIAKVMKPLGVEVEILDVKAMQKLGMNALLGVGQGSRKDSRMVIMKYMGSGDIKKNKPIAFVGKGVTFDTGGISLKPSTGMEDMKYDMGGSAAVVGAIYALAKRKAKVNAIGAVGLVENMPGGNAQRPSDVVKSADGKTIEVLNTDAEGRLVLADVCWYVREKLKPQLMIDLATLTGAITITFGNVYAGLFSNNDKLSEQLLEAGQQTGERLWRLPLGPEYEKMIKSETADIQNISNDKGAGSITAAEFIHCFVGDMAWAHLDIAGVAWTKKDLEICPKGATAFGVRLLEAFASKYYEK